MRGSAGEKETWYQAFILRVKIAAQYCVDTCLLLTGKPAPDRSSHRVLVLRLDGIGDFVLWLDAARATASYYRTQGKGIIFIANSLWADWARELGIFDEVVALDRNRFDASLSYRWRFARRVRMLGCSIAVNPTYSREWLFGDALLRVSGADERIGSTGDLSRMSSWQRRLGDRGYTRLIPADVATCSEHVRNAEFVRGLGDTNYLARVADLHEMGAVKPVGSFIAAIGETRTYYVFFPGSAWSGKRWPSASFAQIADRIFHATGWHGVVCGGPEDVELGDMLCRQSSAPLLNWAGRTDLTDLVGIIAGAQLLVSNDTSATHIAAACGVEGVCILGGGHYGRFLPYKVDRMDKRPLPRVVIHRMPCFGCSWLCIYGMPDNQPHPCIEGVTVSAVWSQVNAILEQTTNRVGV